MCAVRGLPFALPSSPVPFRPWHWEQSALQLRPQHFMTPLHISRHRTLDGSWEQGITMSCSQFGSLLVTRTLQATSERLSS